MASNVAGVFTLTLVLFTMLAVPLFATALPLLVPLQEPVSGQLLGQVGRLAAILVVVSSLLWTIATHAGQACEIVPMPCTFEAVPFRFTVVEAESRQPLADVHALAEWQVHGPGGRQAAPPT